MEKAEKLRYLSHTLKKEELGMHDVDAAIDLKSDWCRMVDQGEKEEWQILQLALSGCDGYTECIPSWAKKPRRKKDPFGHIVKRPAATP